MKRNPKRFVSKVLIILVIFVIIGVVLWYYSRSNVNQAFKPIGKQIEQLGGKSICLYNSNGDPSTGAKPYHYEYYTISDSDTLIDSLKGIVAKDYTIVDYDSELGNSNEKISNNATTYLYLLRKDRKTKLRIAIHHLGPVSLQCMKGASYGEEKSPAPNTAILELLLVYYKINILPVVFGTDE